VDLERVRVLLGKLDRGEAEAIVLAQEVNADLLLVDEQKARRVAAEAGLVVAGVLGVLLRAKAAGLVGAIGPLIVRLRDDLDFFISDSLNREVLRLAGE
jgi:predicted nucleic acid-binding protein